MKPGVLIGIIACSCAFAQIRVNAGGPAYTDSKGNVWAADKSAPNSYGVSSAIKNTADPTLYQTESWAPGKLEYKFTVASGTYSVALKFAEIYFSGAGQRVFNIVINGQQVETSFDPFAAAGGANAAIDKTYPVTVSGGSIDIQLVSVVENPKISAIDIEAVPAPAPAPAPAPTPAPTPTGPSFADQETPAGAIDGTNAAFSLAHVPNPAASLILVRNGVVLHAGADYTLSGSAITFKSFTLPGDLTFAVGIPQTGDSLLAWYRY